MRPQPTRQVVQHAQIDLQQPRLSSLQQFSPNPDCPCNKFAQCVIAKSTSVGIDQQELVASVSGDE